MKKVGLTLVLCLSCCILGQTAAAKETLLDNSLDLKTERLNKEQEATDRTQSFIAEDRLFDTEMMEKVAHAKEFKEKQSEQDKAEFFLVEVPKAKEIDTEELFADGESVKIIQPEETAAAVSSPLSLWPLLLGTALLTVFALFFYYSRRKRG